MDKAVIWVGRKQEYFYERGWTRNALICPSGNLDAAIALDLSSKSNVARGFETAPGLWLHEQRDDLRMLKPDLFFEHFNAAFYLGRSQLISKFQAEYRDNLIGGEMDGQNPVYALDAWFPLGDRADRCIDRAVRLFAYQK